MQPTDEDRLLQAFAKEYLQRENKGDEENYATLAILAIIGALLIGFAMGNYISYQSPQQQTLRSLKSDSQALSKVKHQICH